MYVQITHDSELLKESTTQCTVHTAQFTLHTPNMEHIHLGVVAVQGVDVGVAEGVRDDLKRAR